MIEPATRAQLNLLWHIEHDAPQVGQVRALLGGGVDPRFGTAAPLSSPIGLALHLLFHTPGSYADEVARLLIRQGATLMAPEAPFSEDFILARASKAGDLVRWAWQQERETGLAWRSDKGENPLHLMACSPAMVAVHLLAHRDCTWHLEQDATGQTPLLRASRRAAQVPQRSVHIQGLIKLVLAHVLTGARLWDIDADGARAMELIEQVITRGHPIPTHMTKALARIRNQDEQEQMELRTHMAKGAHRGTRL